MEVYHLGGLIMVHSYLERQPILALHIFTFIYNIKKPSLTNISLFAHDLFGTML